MPGITLFSSIYCNTDAVVSRLLEITGLNPISDEQVIKLASRLSDIPEDKIRLACSPKTSVFNTFTFEKECSIAYLKLALSTLFEGPDFLLSGYTGLLIPRQIHQVLRICLTGEMPERIELAKKSGHPNEKDIQEAISAEDLSCSEWARTLFSTPDYFSSSHYDMVLPMGISDPDTASSVINEKYLSNAVQHSSAALSAISDFMLSSKVEVELAAAGHNINVDVKNGTVNLAIPRKVLMLNRLEAELSQIVAEIPGVAEYNIHTDSSAEQPAVYRKFNYDLPSRLLLVDDEKEFIQTLSERLQMRNMGSVVAYDGESALELVENDDPEVMIVDLKMPGIDGLQVLKKVKQINPKIEVIVLTGHGSEQDKVECLENGAFDYMQKPVDIEHLSEVLKKAHSKIRTGNC